MSSGAAMLCSKVLSTATSNQQNCGVFSEILVSLSAADPVSAGAGDLRDGGGGGAAVQPVGRRLQDDVRALRPAGDQGVFSRDCHRLFTEEEI